MNVHFDGVRLKGLAFINDVQAAALDNAAVQALDILLNITGASIGRVAVAPRELAGARVNQHVAIIRTVEGILPHYVRAFLASPSSQRLIWGENYGVTRPALTKKAIESFDLPLPPLAEQRRIVEKLDALTARTARARADLDRIPALAARYKQAVLEKALSGELTSKKDFPQAEHAGPTLYDDLGLDDQERGTWTTDSLPNGWSWVPFKSIFDDVTDSRRKLPTKYYQDEGRYPIVDQGEVTIAGYTDQADMVNESSPPNIVFGDHTRCVKFVPDQFVQGADGVKVLKPRPLVIPKYAELLLRTIDIPNKGYSRHMKFVRASYFPVCGLAEQAEIVSKVSVAFADIDRMVTEAAAARRLLDRLDQAVLAKAFRGELVPQDPSDEPASVLLDRIRAERAAAPKAKRGRRKAAA